MAVAELTETRMSGTFSGTGLCYTEGVEGHAAFTLTTGTFNTPLVAHI